MQTHGIRVFRTAIFAAILALASAFATGELGALRPASADDDPARVAAAAPIPAGDEGDLIRYGRSIITDTPKVAGQYISAGMSCSACHLAAGTKPKGGSFLGIYAKFPQWNERSKRFIALQDRLAECFLYSMNGRPPAYYSREMIAMTAYIAWLSQGAAVRTGFPDQGFAAIKAPSAPDPVAGAKLYAARCQACHGADGAGNAAAKFPPLWGAKSFNDGAGMNRKMASFVKVNMPVGGEGTLSDQDAVNVSAYVLSHPRPHFNGDRKVSFPAQPARFF